MTEASQRSVRVTISGRVQGVGFRAWVQRQAMARGLSGYVRNRRDGSVEAVFCGEGDTVKAMVAASWEGPRGSRVTDVVVTEQESHPSGPFAIRSTE
jgi:acylphosphatase